MDARSFVLPLLATSFLLAAGCANKDAVRPVEAPVTQTTSGVVAPILVAVPGGDVRVSDDLARVCGIDFNDVATAPKFDFDESSLVAQDRSVLNQVAACVTTGPLKGRALELVGRADPRGEVEYNMALGEHRAGSASAYLAALGVDKAKLEDTSRGKLDATGTDAAGWARDRRVDILLR